MPVPRRRRSTSKRDKQRTHKKLEAMTTISCENCHAPKLRHRVCPSCGTYRGRSYKVVVTS